MRPMRVLAVALFLSSTGLGVTEAQACFFARCRAHRPVVCPPQCYDGYATGQAPSMTAPAPQQAPALDPVGFLLGVVTRQDTFQVVEGGVVRTFRIQRVAVP